VVCTPSGGTRSVRVQLPAGWEERLPDGDILAAVRAEMD
jgi:hypothetical protein